MSILNSLGTVVLGNLVGLAFNNYAAKMYNWGTNLTQQPMVVPTDSQKLNLKETTPIVDPGFNPQQMIGVEDNKWSRKDLRNFRKNSGMSKQEFRDWQAKLLGYQGKNISRRDLRSLKSEMNKDMEDDNYANTVITNSWINRATKAWEEAHPELALKNKLSYMDNELAKLDLAYGNNNSEEMKAKPIINMVVPDDYEEPEELSVQETGNDLNGSPANKTAYQLPLYSLYRHSPYQLPLFGNFTGNTPTYYNGFNYNPYFEMYNDMSRRYFGDMFGFNK